MGNLTGVLLGGGEGTRLFPLTKLVSKQLLPIYDKPMIYYPITLLILSGVRHIVLVTRGKDIPLYRTILGNGSQWGITIEYVQQDLARGIPDGIGLCKNSVLSKKIVVCLGDNIFHGSGLISSMQASLISNNSAASIFLKRVVDPHRYGIAEVSDVAGISSLEEKPTTPKSDLAITGLYCFDQSVFDRIKALKVSARGELEVVDLLKSYLSDGLLDYQILGRGVSWLDTGTHHSMLAASNFVSSLQHTSGHLIGSPEEAALNTGLITQEQLNERIEVLRGNEYGEFLGRLIQ